MRAWRIYPNTLWDGEENWKENAEENMAGFQNILWENISFTVSALGSCKGHFECHSWALVPPPVQTLSCPQHVNASLCWGCRTSPGMSWCVWDTPRHTSYGNPRAAVVTTQTCSTINDICFQMTWPLFITCTPLQSL